MTNVFQIEPLERFESAAIRRPREIAHFSYDEDHKFRLDGSSLRYYYPPLLPADLSKGFDTFKELDDGNDDHLDGLLEALVAYERQKGMRTETDFITWRGMATKIMTVPFSKLDEWEMNATLFQGTIFVEENHAKKLESRRQQHSSGAARGNTSQDLMSFWGYKFETLSLIPNHWSETSREYIEGREDEVVSNYAQYCSIVRTGFGKLKLVLGGEVDAVMDFKSEDPSRPTNWVELKTTAEVNNDRDRVKLERKLLKFWAQSFLLGVPKIIVGYRSQQGILHRLEEMDTQSIPELVRLQGKNMWNGDVCIAFTSAFLQWLKQTVVTEGVWRIRKRANNPVIEVYKVEETGHGDILSQAFVAWRLNELPTSSVANGNGTHPLSEQATLPTPPEQEVLPLSTFSADDEELLRAKAELLKSMQVPRDKQPP
jgi:RAT1-interacting protein